MPDLSIVYSNTGAIRWGADAVANIKWDPTNHVGEASVTDETTGTVYEIGEGGGGGGDSDFSTATVTIVNNTIGSVLLSGYICISDDHLASDEGANTGTSIKTVVLYKGEAEIEVVEDGPTLTVSGTGAVEISDLLLTITGDCTITIDQTD